MATAINTHQLFNKLKATGFKEEQTESVIDTIEKIQIARLENVATKSDIVAVQADTTSLKSDIKITHWGIALLLVVVAIPSLKTLFTG